MCGRVEDAGEDLAVVLGGPVEAHAEDAVVGALPVAAGRVAPDARRIGLVGSAVVAGVVESVGTNEDAKRALMVLGEDQAILAMNVARDVDRTALKGGFLDVAVGAQDPAGGEQSPWAVFGLDQQAVVVGFLGAVAGAQLGLIGGGAQGNDVDYAADGA